jgi:hypothetical protein
MQSKDKLFTLCNEPSADVTSYVRIHTKLTQSKLGARLCNWRTNFINVYHSLFSLFTCDLFMKLHLCI